jgi:hypothetical protein
MNKYWFKQKTYGYWLTPISWEWWLTTLLIAIGIVTIVLLQQAIIKEHILWLLIVLLEIAIISIILVTSLQSKTKWNPKWRWGNKK